MEELPVFRAAKRRKHTKLQSEAAPGLNSPEPTRSPEHQLPGGEVDNQEGESSDNDVANVVKVRKQFRRPATGVKFSNTQSIRSDEGNGFDSALARADQSIDKPIDITQRFVGSSGQVVDVDQHMIAFIDSEMAKRRNVQSSSLEHQSRPSDDDSNTNKVHTSSQTLGSLKQGTSRNPTSTQQLSEVDLGDSAHHINLARTQAALERARLGKAPIEEEIKPPKPRKPRIGRDGKPMKPRPRKRRNSEDIARDALVEQVLQENKLDLYETGNDGQRTSHISAGDVQGDDRLAEQFRQDFMDAIAERQQRNKAASQPKVPGATESKGPKLGGSRSARAKMAQMQQQQQSQGQGKK